MKLKVLLFFIFIYCIVCEKFFESTIQSIRSSQESVTKIKESLSQLIDENFSNVLPNFFLTIDRLDQIKKGKILLSKNLTITDALLNPRTLWKGVPLSYNTEFWNQIRKEAEKGEQLKVLREIYHRSTKVFIHIQKSAGSTMKGLLYTWRRNVTNYLNSKGKAGWTLYLADVPHRRTVYAKMSENMVSSFDIIIGSGGLYICSEMLISKPCMYFFILRDPIERMISDYIYCHETFPRDNLCGFYSPQYPHLVPKKIYKDLGVIVKLTKSAPKKYETEDIIQTLTLRQEYLKKNNPKLKEATLLEWTLWRSNWQLTELSVRPEPLRFRPESLKYNAFYLERELGKKNDQSDLQRVIGNLVSDFSMVGLAENMTETIEMLTYMMGIDHMVDGTKIESRNQRTKDIEVNENEIKEMRKILDLEYQLYENVKLLFEKQRNVFKDLQERKILLK